MDFNKLCTAEAHENGAELEIYSPLDSTKTDFVIVLKGQDSNAFRFKNNSNVAALTRKLYNKEKVSDEEADLMDIDTFVECTIGWKNLNDGDKEIHFSKEKCKELYIAAPYVRAQVEAFITKRANFTMG